MTRSITAFAAAALTIVALATSAAALPNTFPGTVTMPEDGIQLPKPNTSKGDRSAYGN